jgi:DNA-binding CsgD family transcriptional regulator/tetratricopeptide (TPR) repeat protein
MAARRPPVLLGRASEREALDGLLDNVRGGQSAVLVIRGEAGVGKTALLRYCARQASGFRAAQIAGVEAEMELPFAGLHQLCAPMLARLDTLPEPQRDALCVALGLASGAAPDRFLVALAVLSLLSAVAEERPLLCLVDDAQWLDGASSQVLGFVARRLLAESVAIVLAVREPAGEHAFDGLPELPLGGLDEEAALALLARVIPGRLDGPIRDRIVAETRGNPLALLDLPRGMSAAELAGGFEVPGAGDLPGRLEEHYLRRVGDLPETTQRLMLLAAADPVGDATLVWGAAQRLGIGTAALAPAKAAALLEIGAQVRFRHPLVRSAVYRAASSEDREAVHEALAQVSDPEVDGDRRAWHRSLAVAGPDENVATELEHSAARAQTRGGLAAAAAFLDRAAALSADPGRRARRALEAAQAKHQAGAPEAALALLASAQAGPLDQLQRAQAQRLRAQITFTSNRGSDAPALLLTAAQQLERLDVTLARETYLEALMAAQFAGRLADGAALEVAEAARAAPPSSSPRAPDVLLDGLAAMITEGHRPAARLLKRAVQAFRNGDAAETGGFRWMWLAEEAAIETWDHDSWRELAVRELRLVREAGALTVLPLALSANTVALIFAGELAAAASLIDEVKIVTEATGTQLAPYGPLILAAWRGREAELGDLTDATLKEALPRGEGIGVSTAQWANAVLHNGLARYERAATSARQVLEAPRGLDATVNWVLPELVEAAVRCDATELARDALQRLTEITRAGGTDWALGLEARSRALLSEDEPAERSYREAIERLGRTRVRGEHARAHLLYGEWLRREGRRKDAREQLRVAHGRFVDMGMEAFAERARRELQATGATTRKRRAATRDELTPQEEQIARLARDGLTNSEIGSQLFLSPRTVEWHLRKVFTKLGITSRMGLHDALPREVAPA